MNSAQPKNPLHGMTLEAILNALVSGYGWHGLGQRINIRCFNHEPSIASSLKFLRRTPWAREQVEMLYLAMQKRETDNDGAHHDL
ncbi:MAG: VF530 family protein [Sulfuritalea sp.]|nr:VF530 family protein [Sulfuritalea sp.]